MTRGTAGAEVGEGVAALQVTIGEGPDQIGRCTHIAEGTFVLSLV